MARGKGTVILRALGGEIKQQARPRTRHEQVSICKYSSQRNLSRNYRQLLEFAPHALLIYHVPRSFDSGIHAALCGSEHDKTDGTGKKSMKSVFSLQGPLKGEGSIQEKKPAAVGSHA